MFLKAIKNLRYRAEELLVRIFLLLFRVLSRKQASGICGAVCRFVGPRLKVSSVARENIALAFSGIAPAQTEEIVKETWENFGRGIGEFPYISRMSEEEFLSLIETEGLQNLEAARGRGAVFVTAHFGNWELLPRFLGMQGFPISLVYRPANNPYVNRIINSMRATHGTAIYPKGQKGMIAIAKALKSGGYPGILFDQKLNDGEKVPLFGRDAMTSTAPAGLAARFGAAMIPVRVERIGKTRYRVIISTPLLPKPGEELSATLQLNRILEKWVSAKPGQWFWMHRRWPKVT